MPEKCPPVFSLPFIPQTPSVTKMKSTRGQFVLLLLCRNMGTSFDGMASHRLAGGGPVWPVSPAVTREPTSPACLAQSQEREVSCCQRKDCASSLHGNQHNNEGSEF